MLNSLPMAVQIISISVLVENVAEGKYIGIQDSYRRFYETNRDGYLVCDGRFNDAKCDM